MYQFLWFLLNVNENSYFCCCCCCYVLTLHMDSFSNAKLKKFNTISIHWPWITLYFTTFTWTNFTPWLSCSRKIPHSCIQHNLCKKFNHKYFLIQKLHTPSFFVLKVKVELTLPPSAQIHLWSKCYVHKNAWHVLLFTTWISHFPSIGYSPKTRVLLFCITNQEMN